ncbi:hypothetical protein [Nonomuraea africana]|uniref:Alkaline shock response membrane anchor protein AmaP n=1 Tax=Nonomuraea africana TaxID=46171 RepID=A0ABR9KWB2_9ACTN|nr:hypothetical protein [Nonomuraea africana]MBE1566298.1 hypothetical protein [Nonomuraea africana]
MMRQYAGNRIGLSVVGVVLLGGGAYTFLRGTGRLPQAKEARVLDIDVAAYLAAHPWISWAGALALVLAAMVTVRWLLMALGWGRLGHRSGTGTALLCVGLKDMEGISRTKVRVVGGDRMRIAVTCPATADVGALVGKLDKEIVGRIRRDVGAEGMGALVRLHVRRGPANPRRGS